MNNTKDTLREKIARGLHEEYEKVAKEVGWKTQESTQVPFEDLPEANKKVMLHMGDYVAGLIYREKKRVLLTMLSGIKILQEQEEQAG